MSTLYIYIHTGVRKRPGGDFKAKVVKKKHNASLCASDFHLAPFFISSAPFLSFR